MNGPGPSESGSPADKAKMVVALASALAAISIPLTVDASTDIAITAELFDAAWGTGRKKITYEAAILADEASRTVLMWEKTLEVGRGISLKVESNSSLQVGKTLFRRLKGTHYGPDGVAHEYEVDLGAIPAAVKATARKLGWKFRTVLSRPKAHY